MNKKIKISHVVNMFETGGMENGVVNICNLLDRTKFEVSICCVNDIGAMAKRLNPDVQVANLCLKEGIYPLRFLKLARFFKNDKPDIVHTHGWGACSFDGILGARLARIPAVINGEHGTFYLKKHQIFAQRFLSKLCDMTLSVSEFLKREIENNLGITQARITVIPNGVDTKIFNGNYDKRDAKLQLLKGSEDKRIIICSIGSLKPVKNQIMLLKALKLIYEENTDSKVAIVFIGEGPDMKMLNDYVVGNGLNGKCFFLGIRDDVPELLSGIDVLVSTSKTEGAPNVLLEGMASGIPVVASSSGGANEYLIDGENGYLVEQDDIRGLKEKILLLLNNERRTIMGKVAYDFVSKNYSIKKMILLYEKLYSDLYAKI